MRAVLLGLVASAIALPACGGDDNGGGGGESESKKLTEEQITRIERALVVSPTKEDATEFTSAKCEDDVEAREGATLECDVTLPRGPSGTQGTATVTLNDAEARSISFEATLGGESFSGTTSTLE